MPKSYTRVRARLVIGPSEVDQGTDWNLEVDTGDGEWESHSSGGSNRGPQGQGHRGTTDPDVWLAYAKRKMKAPRLALGWSGNGRRYVRLRWTDATIKPFGYSQGSGHAPNGIRLEWDVKVPDKD